MAVLDRQRELRILGLAAHGVGFAIVVVAWSVYHFALTPVVLSHEQEYQEGIRQLQSALSEAPKIRNEYDHLTKSLSNIEKRAEAIRHRIPDDPNEAEFLRQITDAADVEGLEIHDYQVGMASETPTHSQVDVRLVCHGNYAAICGFLDYLSKLPRITRVQKLEITSNLTDDSFPVEINLSLYFGAKSTVKAP